MPIILIFIGIINIYSYLNEGDFGITNLDIRGASSQIISTGSGELLKGDVATGRFHSSFPNLGIVSVRFYNQDRDSNDTLAFRFRESDKKDWYYQANYKTDQFLPHKLFPFGFPIIADSQNKDYVFEIESLSGATGSGILIDYQNPVFVAKSTFKGSELLKDKTRLLSFLGNKFVNIFGEPETRLNVIISFLPLIIYFTYLITYGISYQILTVIILSFTIWDIFYLRNNYDYLYLSVIFGWCLISKRYKFESRIAALFAMLYLGMTPIFLIVNQESIAEKFAVWAYLFLCITVVQQIFEFKFKGSNILELKEFFKNLSHIKIHEDAYIYKTPFAVNIVLALSSMVLLNSAIQTVSMITNQYRLYFQENLYWNLLKGTFFAWLISFVTVFVVYLMIKNIKDIWLKIFILFFSAYMIISFSLNRSLDFVGKAKLFRLSIPQTSEAWVDVAIQGINLKDVPFVGKVYIDNSEQRIISWSDKQVVFRTTPQYTKTGNVYVVTQDNQKTDSLHFEYDFK